VIGKNLGQFQILEKIGQGGMGQVYRAHDTKLGRDVAIKVLPQTVAADPGRLARLEQEARALASLNHSHIASIYDFKSVDDIFFLVMELVPGEDLSRRCKAGPIPLEESLSIGLQVADALAAAHLKGIIHRDLKPDNIMIMPGDEVKILDFGLAKRVLPKTDKNSTASALTTPQDQTIAGTVLGTAPYMSPEQARGQPVDERTDIWAFGCTLFEMLTGTAPFRSTTAIGSIAAVLERVPDWSKLPSDIPPRVQELLHRCLEKEIEERLPEMGLAHAEVSAALAELALSKENSVGRAKRRWLLFAGAVVTCAAVATAGFLLLRNNQVAPTPQVAGSVTQLMVGVGSAGALQQSVIEYELSNGIKMLILERHAVPIFTGIVHVDVGSTSDPKGASGLAHMIEHMAFKGSSRIGTTDIAAERRALAKVDAARLALLKADQGGGAANTETDAALTENFRLAQEEAAGFVVSNELAEVFERHGVNNLNGRTYHDHTHYYSSLPSNKLELWFNLESERFRDPVFREFYKEVEVIKEERRNRVESNPIGQLVQEFLSVAFKAHAYRNSSIGWTSDIDNLTRSATMSFFKNYYVPQNMTLILVGDVIPEEAITLAERYFGSLPPQEPPERFWTQEPPQLRERRFVLTAQSQPLLLIGFHAPAARHPDSAVIDVIAELLAGDRTSRLQHRLVEQEKTAVQVFGSAGFPGRQHANLFIVGAISSPGHTNAEIEAVLLAELGQLSTEPVSHRELKRVKRRARVEMLAEIDTNEGIALALSNDLSATGDWRDLFRHLDAIDAVTRADIQRVAAKYLTKANRVVGLLQPEGATQGD